MKKGWTKEDLHQFILAAQRHAVPWDKRPEAGAPKTMREALNFLGLAIMTLLHEETPQGSSQLPPDTRKAMRIALLRRALQAWFFLSRRQLEVKARTYQAGRTPKLKPAERKAKVLGRYEQLRATKPALSEARIRTMIAQEFPELSERTLRSYISKR